jgi:hypothetical protein
MNGRLKKMSEKKLPTKSELMTKMQAACDSVNDFSDRCLLKVVDDVRNGYLFFETDLHLTMVGHEYQPDSVPPAKFESVFVRGDGPFRQFYARPMVSTGLFNTDGCLIVYADEGTDAYRDWCSIKDRSHHSPGWERQREPDYGGNQK